MKKVFARTRNVQAFHAGMEAVQAAPPKDSKMALVYGAYGTGKTETVMKFSRDNGYPYVRCHKIDTARTLIERIVVEYRVVPRRRAAELYDQAVDAMMDSDRWLLVDEVDYLLDGHGGAKMIEMLRDLHDDTDVPVILIGMDSTLSKLKARGLSHLIDRFRALMRFEPFNAEGMADLARQICEVELTDEAVAKITAQSRGRIRPAKMWFDAAERWARRNNVAQVGLEHLAKLRVVTDEGR